MERHQVKHIYETIKNLYGKDPKLLVIDQKTGYQPGERLEVDFWSFSALREPVDGCKVRWWITGGKGRITEGEFDADVAPDTAKRIGRASWDIPEGESGFHSLFCILEDQDGNTLFVNDYYFDVGPPEKPAILWVKVVDDQGNLLNGANVQTDGFTRITDEFGRVPFLLNTGRYRVEAEAGGETQEMDVEVKSGETKEIVCILH